MRNLLKKALVTAFMIPVTSAIIPMTATPSSANVYCQCTTYVSQRFGNFRYPAHAGDWDTNVLPQAGFRRIGSPQVGAVVVMERSFPGANRTYGHVGIVEQIFPDGRISLRGANQSVGSSMFAEAGCSNVRITPFRASVNGRGDISFWVRGGGTSNPENPSSGSNIRNVNFSGVTAPGGVNVRSGPSGSSSAVGRLAPNQRVNFDAWTYGSTETDIWLRTPDARWYRIAGTNNWVASAVVYGNAPGSRPML